MKRAMGIVAALVVGMVVGCGGVRSEPAPLAVPSLPAESRVQSTHRLQVLTDASDHVSFATSPASADERYSWGVVVQVTATCVEGTVHWQTTAIGRGVVETMTNRTSATLSVVMDQDRVVFVRCVAPMGG